MSFTISLILQRIFYGKKLFVQADSFFYPVCGKAEISNETFSLE